VETGQKAPPINKKCYTNAILKLNAY
jgi:hypothetical protein